VLSVFRIVKYTRLWWNEHVAVMEQKRFNFITLESVIGRPRREGNVRLDGTVP